MRPHCSNCNYTAETDWEEACPICGRPFAHAGNPDPWYNRRLRVQSVVRIIMIAFSCVVIVALSLRIWQNLR